MKLVVCLAPDPATCLLTDNFVQLSFAPRLLHCTACTKPGNKFVYAPGGLKNCHPLDLIYVPYQRTHTKECLLQDVGRLTYCTAICSSSKNRRSLTATASNCSSTSAAPLTCHAALRTAQQLQSRPSRGWDFRAASPAAAEVSLPPHDIIAAVEHVTKAKPQLHNITA